MKTLLALLLLIPSLSWGVTFKGGEVVNKSINSNDDSNNKEYEQKYLDPNHVFKFHKKLKWIEDTGVWSTLETHDRISQNPWNLRYETNVVRNGKYSLRFEMRDSDCHRGDCPRGERKGAMGRSEVTISNNQSGKYSHDHGEHWYAWSMYIPKETTFHEGWTILGQFKETNSSKERNKIYKECENEDVGLRLGFKLQEEGLVLFREACYSKENQVNPKYHKVEKIILFSNQLKNRKDQWLDFLMHVNWSYEDDGFINLWLNDKKAYEHEGINSSIPVKYKGKLPGVLFRFGIYNGFRSEPLPPQVIYYDAFKKGKDCMAVSQFYDCEMIKESKLNSTDQLLKELDFDIN
jgi:hypothetical protein